MRKGTKILTNKDIDALLYASDFISSNTDCVSLPKDRRYYEDICERVNKIRYVLLKNNVTKIQRNK
jgi:hypothetical protein